MFDPDSDPETDKSQQQQFPRVRNSEFGNDHSPQKFRRRSSGKSKVANNCRSPRLSACSHPDLQYPLCPQSPMDKKTRDNPAKNAKCILFGRHAARKRNPAQRCKSTNESRWQKSRNQALTVFMVWMTLATEVLASDSICASSPSLKLRFSAVAWSSMKFPFSFMMTFMSTSALESSW